ncbi:MAG: FMN-binding protein [Gammaproteobacteria bacterium]|nr:FMN-binding protein [Gammaproteobacteria bacterium]
MTARTKQEEQAPGPLRLILTLAIAGLVSGIAIIGIYESTLPTITANKARELREAVFKVLPGVSQMQQLIFRNGELVASEDMQKGEQAVYGGYDAQGDFVGYAIPGAGPGFQDTIGLLYGYAPKQQLVLGMEVLESRETPGLGDKIYKDDDFVGSFSALSIVPEIVAVKKGKRTQANEIDAITGATISSKAVVRIINETHSEWSERLPSPGSEPPLGGSDSAGAGK